MELRILLTILVGCISGIFGGAFGLGGSFIMLPGLILFNIIPDFKTASGTILLSVLPPVSLLAVYEYHKQQKIDYVISGILLITYFIFAYFGALINRQFDNKSLKYGCAISFLLLTIFFFYDAYNTKSVK